MTPARRLTAGLVLAGALLGATACAPSVDPFERLGRKAARHMTPRPSDTAGASGEAGVAGAPGDRGRTVPETATRH
ncbi:hypothetical protein [Streptomyces sp. NPDC006551]|uniref:hypothetical protein n=1 Tax=Streptomyces sp. NPDC006551 TaxID=3157178 RepID=UPI0033B95164